MVVNTLGNNLAQMLIDNNAILLYTTLTKGKATLGLSFKLYFTEYHISHISLTEATPTHIFGALILII